MLKKRILILGGSGFIGRNLVNFYCNDTSYSVHATYFKNKSDDVRCYYHQIDLTDKAQVAKLFSAISPDIVINAAAVTTGSKDVIERPYLHVTDNTIMNAIIFEACHEFSVKHCIFLSCTVMYQPKQHAQPETEWNIAEEIYPAYFGVGNMKVYSEKLCEFYSRLGRCKYTAIRHSNVYGPYDKFDLDKCHVVPAMIRKVSEATDSLEIWGDGKAARDIIYVDDVVKFIDRCIEFQDNRFELFNCGIEKAYSILEIIQTLQDILDKKDLKIFYNTAKPNIPTTVILDCSKAKKLLHWEPKTDLVSGFKKTIEWYSLYGKTRN